MMENKKSETLLEVKNLKKYFKTPGGMLHAVDDVSFRIQRGRTLGVVGESGCGKSTLGRTLLCLNEPTAGEILFQGTDIAKLGKKQMKAVRPKMQMIFQDPYSSLNGRMTIRQLIAEPLIVNKLCKKRQENILLIHICQTYKRLCMRKSFLHQKIPVGSVTIDNRHSRQDLA